MPSSRGPRHRGLFRAGVAALLARAGSQKYRHAPPPPPPPAAFICPRERKFKI